MMTERRALISRRRFDSMNCAAAQALDRIGDWWTLLIIREAFYGTTSFTEFQRTLGIARNVLADRLESLVDTGIFQRRETRPGVNRHRYELTDMGRDLLPVLIALMQWGDRWVFGSGQEPISLVDARAREPIRQIAIQASDGRSLDASGIRFRPGPGAAPETLLRFRKPGDGLEKETGRGGLP